MWQTKLFVVALLWCPFSHFPSRPHQFFPTKVVLIGRQQTLLFAKLFSRRFSCIFYTISLLDHGAFWGVDGKYAVAAAAAA